MSLSVEQKKERAMKEMIALETAAKALLDAHQATRFTLNDVTHIVKSLAQIRQNNDRRLSEYEY